MSSTQRSYMPDGLLAGGQPSLSPKTKTTALVLSSLFRIAANIAITYFRLTLMDAVGFEGFLPLILRYIVNSTWVQLYTSLTGAESVDPVLAVALAGVVSMTFAYFDGMVMGTVTPSNTNSSGR
jgi:hypothetical protein